MSKFKNGGYCLTEMGTEVCIKKQDCRRRYCTIIYPRNNWECQTILWQDVHSCAGSNIVLLNLDETPIFLDLSWDYTLHFQGQREVKVINHPRTKTRLTFMPCVTHEGEVLPPLFVCQYKYGKSLIENFLLNMSAWGIKLNLTWSDLLKVVQTMKTY